MPGDAPSPGGERTRRRWQIEILLTTWLTYFGYYFCRKAFYVVKKTMGAELDFSAIDLQEGATSIVADDLHFIPLSIHRNFVLAHAR